MRDSQPTPPPVLVPRPAGDIEIDLGRWVEAQLTALNGALALLQGRELRSRVQPSDKE